MVSQHLGLEVLSYAEHCMYALLVRILRFQHVNADAKEYL